MTKQLEFNQRLKQPIFLKRLYGILLRHGFENLEHKELVAACEIFFQKYNGFGHQMVPSLKSLAGLKGTIFSDVKPPQRKTTRRVRKLSKLMLDFKTHADNRSFTRNMVDGFRAQQSCYAHKAWVARVNHARKYRRKIAAQNAEIGR